MFNNPTGSDTSWGMFALTGNPAYYLLYRNLLMEDDELAEEEKLRR